MATGSFGGQLESAISGRLTGDPYEKRRQAAMGSYQDQASKSRKDLSERLNRLGVLRGGGATASQFGEFESGVLRGQQSIDAQFEAQRDAGVGQAIQQGIGLYGTNQQYGLAGRQQNEAERMGQFSRDLGTREFQSQDALRRDQQRESERSALAQEGMQRGALTGIYDGNRTLDQQRQDLAYRTGLAQTFGRDIAGNEGATEAARAQGVQERYQQAGVTGTFDGKDTLQKSLSEAELTGRYGAEDTLASQSLALQEGQALGTIDGQDTLAREAQREDRDLQAILGQAQINQQTAERASRVSESALEREARVGESQSDRELRAIQSQQQFNLATADRASREGMQQAQFGEDARGREFQQTESTRDREFQMQMRASELEAQGVQAAEARKLAREELYGGVTTDYERAMGAKTLASSGQAADIAAENRRLAEMETAGISQRDIADRGMTEAEAAGVSQRGLAERELTQRSALASEQRALEREQLYGRAMTREEQMSGLGYSGGTLGAQELEQAATQADLQRGLAREELYGYREDASGRRQQTLGARESQAQRGIQERELTQRGELAGADITSREGLARSQRTLDREALYGTGDLNQQRGSTLAARDTAAARGLEERRLTEAERAGADTSRLQEAELYGRQLSDYERSMGGTVTASSRQAAEDLALRGELGRGQLEQDTRRTDLARDDLRGYSELYPGGMREDTAAVREGKAARGLESRRLDEIERSALAGEGLQARGLGQDSRRLDLAAAELYGTANEYEQGGSTLAAREAGRDREQRVLDRSLDRERLDLAEEELYGGAGMRSMAGGTLAAREAVADRTSREGMAASDIASREGIASKGRALSREEIYGTGDSRQYGGDTLRRQQYDADQSRQNALDMRTALGMMQNLPEGYQPTEIEAKVLSELLGKPDIARFGGRASSDLTDEERAGYNPFGYELTGSAVPVRNPNAAGGGGGGEVETTRRHNFMTNNPLFKVGYDPNNPDVRKSGIVSDALHSVGGIASGSKIDVGSMQARVNADRASKGLPPITLKREGNRIVQVG